VQAIALGQISSLDDARAVVRRSFEVIHFEPDTAVKTAWDAAYEKLLNIVEESL
jgi:hypothetical protein